MRINNSYLIGAHAGQIQKSQEAAAASQPGNTKSPQAPVADQHLPSPELARLRQLLQQTPDTRTDVLAHARQQLSAGAYTTPEAAQSTADAIIQALD